MNETIKLIWYKILGMDMMNIYHFLGAALSPAPPAGVVPAAPVAPPAGCPPIIFYFLVLAK